MSTRVEHILATDEDEVNRRWSVLLQWLEERYGKQASIESILFLIGIQSRGQGYQPRLSKQAKQDLIMEGTYLIFETLGLYKRVGIDSEGRTVWERSSQAVPRLSLPEQEKVLKVAILTYFESILNEV